MKKILAGLMTVALCAAWTQGSGLMAAPHKLSDEEMDKVSCGDSVMVSPGSGTVNSTITDNSVWSIDVSGQAQQNLTSLVNILSINSTIQVMLNLNVNVNSTVGSVAQGNTGTVNGTP